MAGVVTAPSGMVLDQSIRELQEIAIDLSGAAVASCRRVRFKQEVELLAKESWASGFTPIGKLAKVKHQDDCRTTAS